MAVTYADVIQDMADVAAAHDTLIQKLVKLRDDVEQLFGMLPLSPQVAALLQQHTLTLKASADALKAAEATAANKPV